MSDERITGAEIAELERRVAHAPARPNYIELNYCYAMLRRLLSERREREGKLAEAEAQRDAILATVQSQSEQRAEAFARVLAAEAAIARVRELQREQLARCDQQNADDSESDYERGYIAGKRLVLASIARVLTTPTVVSSDRLGDDRDWYEGFKSFTRAYASGSDNIRPTREGIARLISIIDRLAPSVSHQEGKGNG